MSHDLANGLQFLHDSGIAHMDIKPRNLVYDPKTLVLQIIDFNAIVWVKNSDKVIRGRRGTTDWMAPGLYIEVERGKAFKPILADRYPCGLVFQRMLLAEIRELATEEHWTEMRSFPCALMNDEPESDPA
ncbi:kinase-like domain-containing protein [Rhodocollybia butyracea]|uniref:Kinase-like domain-containing protein n=1 Tax=Rhodocollybia butyracea TaxID=206335 RepID=A0A9P5PMQ4_9AGAR|nr:kinase-like domain-containing protein [Rhodocollybia butyracea]